MSSLPRYADIYDYDHLSAAASGTGITEEELLNLHNMLVWHQFHPRENAMLDDIVCKCIESVAAAKNIQVGAIKDPDILELVGALF